MLAGPKQHQKNNLQTISYGILIAVFFLYSEIVVYLTCLLIPAYFTFRAFKEKSHENVRLKIMRYWICYAFLSFPIKFITNVLTPNDLANNLIQILVFSNLYHPRSQFAESLLEQIQKILTKYDHFFRRFTKGFMDGFEAEIMKK